MMTTLEIAQQLLKNRCNNAQALALANECSPQGSDQAFAIQDGIIKVQGSAVIGWKCALPINEHQFVAAPIFESDFFNGENDADETKVALFSENKKARVEPEIAFKLGQTLLPKAGGYSESEIDNAIISTHMALELIQDRYAAKENVSFYEKQADCFSNQGLYLGKEINKEQAYCSENIEISIKQNNNEMTFKGIHQNGLPQNPLYWLVNFMSKRGVTLHKGEVIITGSYAGVIELEFNQRTELNYNGIGKSTLILVEK